MFTVFFDVVVGGVDVDFALLLLWVGWRLLMLRLMTLLMCVDVVGVVACCVL